MPAFVYRCFAGHETVETYASWKHRRRRIPCGQCTRVATYDFAATARGQSHPPEFFEYFSEAHDAPVRSRQELATLDRKMGLQVPQPPHNPRLREMQEKARWNDKRAGR